MENVRTPIHLILGFSRFLNIIFSNPANPLIGQIGVQTMIDECESFRDKLLYSLCHAHEMEGKPKQFEGKQFDRLFEIARISNFSAEELSEYEASRMNMLDYNASMTFARKEGIALGRDEGIALGRDEGLQQAARQMKAKGFNTAVISEITGLSAGEIEGLD